MQEQQSAQNAWFVTLTYNDQNLPYAEGTLPSLNKLDLQHWMKRLRRRIDRMSPELYNFQMATNEKKQIRYYTVGEYGTHTERPHYHSIIFNVPKMELQKAHLTWKHGSVYLGAVTPASIHYVTGYVISQNKKKSMNLGRQPEFAMMSRRPGLGISYVNRKSKWNTDNQYNYVMNNGHRQAMPRYLKNKIFSLQEIQKFSDQAQVQSQINYEKTMDSLRAIKIENPEEVYQYNRYHESLQFEKNYNKTEKF